jgi:hypothetical protein
MKELQGLVSQPVYSDEAHFSDQLLLPALASGHHVTLVSAFVPSYLMRLVEDLASSPEIEPGKLTVIFCVPSTSKEQVSEARLLSRYISLSASSFVEVKSFLESSMDLAKEGGLRFGALLSKEDQLLTPSCVGIIESCVPGSNEILGFTDTTAGDLNSPIPVQGSWGDEGELLGAVLRVVSSALNRTFPNLLRKSHQEVLGLIHEIREKGYPKHDFPIGSVEQEDRKKHPEKASKSVVKVPDLVDEDEVFELLIEDEDFAVERILREVFLREAGFQGEDVTAFLGEDSFDEMFGFDWDERQHTPPLGLDLVEVVGRGYTSCWCGESFDREQGCPERYL